MFIYGGKPFAQVQEVSQLLASKVNGHITITEAQEIVAYLYSSSDAEEIMRRVDREKEFAEQSRVLVTREEKIVDQQKSTVPLINYKRFKRVVVFYNR